MRRAWQPLGDASWDAEAEARRRRARRMQAIGSWVRGPARMQPARRLPLRQALKESGRRARRVCGAIMFAETILCPEGGDDGFQPRFALGLVLAAGKVIGPSGGGRVAETNGIRRSVP